MEARAQRLVSKVNSELSIDIIPGHFATNHSHINFYIDMTNIKCTHTMSKLVAEEFATNYSASTLVDTIVCLDGTEMIAAFLANHLAQNGVNNGECINIVTPEFNSNGQMIFRDNIQKMVWKKNIILLVASATTGKTINRSLECVQYYNGKVRGISAIFSAVDSIGGIDINSIFKKDDLTDYRTYAAHECPECLSKKKLDAIVNSFGYSKL